MNATKLITSLATAAVVAGSIGLAYAQSSDRIAAPNTDAVPTQPEAAPMTHPAMPADQGARPAGNMGSTDTPSPANSTANSTPMDNSSMPAATPSTSPDAVTPAVTPSDTSANNMPTPAERPPQADRN